MKTRTPARNVKNIRRAGAIRRLEARLKLPDSALLKTAKCLQTDPNIGVKAYRSEMEHHLSNLKALLIKKGGSL